MIKSKKLMCIALSALLASVFTGCGKKASEPDDLVENNISQADRDHSDTLDPESTPFVAESVPQEFAAEGDNITTAEGGGVDVAVDVRNGDERYEFEEEDLGFIDTASGAVIKIGMTIDEIESLIGVPRSIDSQRNRFYSGIAIQYDDNMTATRLVVAGGNMEGSDNPVRFVTPRGIRLGDSIDAFMSVYGDDYNDPAKAAEGDDTVNMSATMAVRYYKQEGSSFTYAGSSYSGDQVPANDSSRITQTFIFSPETGGVSVISLERGRDAN